MVKFKIEKYNSEYETCEYCGVRLSLIYGYIRKTTLHEDFDHTTRVVPICEMCRTKLKNILKESFY